MFFNLKLKIEGDKAISIRSQYGRDQILETVAGIRQVGGLRDMEGLGRWALSIPFEDWIALRAKYPDLASSDPKVKSRAYLRFMNTPEAERFRMREKV